MTISRKAQISLADTPYYHCIARCVRRAFLCGEDKYTGKDFSHRRTWLVERLMLQASIFGIDICAYAIMANHYHAVVRVDRGRVSRWSDEEVMERWTRLFDGPLLVKRLLAGKPLNHAERATVAQIAAVWRGRLHDISWFMRCLNEYIARRANAEDDCRGRFWEGRFRSQALLDEAALLSCMAYVDLNPIRAGMVSSLEESDFTSIQDRLRTIDVADSGKTSSGPAHPLLPFSAPGPHQQPSECLRFRLKDYIALVEATGRRVRSDKPGFIPADAKSVLDKMGLSEEQWLQLTLEIHASSIQAIGSLGSMRRYCESSGRHWVSGVGKLVSIFQVA